MVVRRQVVMVPGSGLVGAVWWVFVRGVRWKQVCYTQVVHGLGVGLDESVISAFWGHCPTISILTHDFFGYRILVDSTSTTQNIIKLNPLSLTNYCTLFPFTALHAHLNMCRTCRLCFLHISKSQIQKRI